MLFNLFTPSYPVVDVNIPEGWWKSDSQLDIDFANNRSFNRKTAYKGRPSELLTYTSPSPKMVFSESGVLKYAPHNLLTYSQEFDNAAWTVAQATITANSTTAPDRTLTADTLNDVNAGTYAELRRTDNVAFVSGHTYSVSVYLKQNTKRYASLALHSVYFGANVYAFFDLQTGTIKETGLGAAVVGSEISDAGNGWYRCTLKATATASGNGRLYIYPMNDAGTSINYTGTGASALYVWGTQINRGSVVLDYLATTSAAKYDLPIDYHPTTHAALGVLIEEQRTNLLTYSQEFDNAAWTKNASSISATNITAPDDTATAELLASNTDNAIHYLFVGSPPSITSGVTYTGSVFLKKGTGSTAPDWMQLSLSGASFGSIQYANFNLMTGEVGTVGAGATATVEDVGGGWYRCSITATATSTSGGSLLVVFTNNNDALGRVPAYADATTSNVCVWGAQLEAGAFATSYIQTGSAQVTRAADQVSLATSAFNYGAAEGTLMVEASVNAFKSTSNRIASLYGASSRLADVYALPASSIAYYKTSDSSQLTIGLAVVAQTLFKVGIAYKLNDYQGALGGTLGGADTSTGTLPVDTSTLGIGNWNNNSTSFLDGHLKRLTYWNTRKSNPELQGLSV